jgi:DNA-binding beta-propeller fold protein YncE
MRGPRPVVVLAAALQALVQGCATAPASSRSSAATDRDAAPFAADPAWPRPLPSNWILGQVAGIAVDDRDHVWIVQRPKSLTDDERGAALDPPVSKCCLAAPPVMEFDSDGTLLQAWGGPGPGYDWPSSEHGISVDASGYVWIAANGETDGQVLKFARDGRFVAQFGRSGPQTGSSDVTRFGRPATAEVDPSTNELYVADGYHNRRVIVVDAQTGTYKRHWGAYGKPPRDEGKVSLSRPTPPPSPPPQDFGNPVHCARVSHDGFVYVCDRLNDRIQVFRKDGTYVKEFIVEPRTAANGSTWDIAISRDPQQRYLFVADGRNNQILILLRLTGEVAGSFGRPGRSAGDFHWVHDIAIDSKGNLYTGEVDTGKRVQRFVPRGPLP